jgi:ribosome maturation protein SDO1
MVSVEEAVIAKIRKGGKEFQILVDCERAMELRKGMDVDMADILAAEQVFKDAKKGETASGLSEAFGTDNVVDIAKEIIKHGEVQLNTKYRSKLVDEKRKQVIAKISAYAMDPRTNNPIPEKRIELALEQVKYSFDPFRSSEEQVKEVVEALKPVLPIAMAMQKIQVVFPAQYAPKAYGVVSKFGKTSKDMWLNNGSWLCEIEVPAGLREKLFSEVNSLTRGSADIRIVGDENE